jgi:TRAP-type C4-dicarboxylate transport system permease small subunit
MFAKFFQKVHRGADFLNALMFFLITAGVLVAVSGRYLFRVPLPGAMELAYFAMLWCAFLQTGKALYEGRHIGTPFIKERLSGKAEAAVSIFVNLIILFSSAFLTWYSAKFTWDSYVRNWYYSGALPLPKVFLYGIMALGSLYLTIIALIKILDYLGQIRKG